MDTNTDLDRHVEEFKEQGFTVFERVHDAEMMERWKRKFEQMQGEVIESSHRASWWFGNMLEHAPLLMMPAVTNPTLCDFAERVMGPFVQLDNLTLAGFPSITPKEAKGKVSGWHRDRWAQMPRSEAYERPLSINMISYLQDLTPEYGPLRAIAGSHRKPIGIAPAGRNRPHPDEKLLCLNAGDVVVTHSGLIHSGTPNTSGQTRYFFSVYLNLTWLKTTDNHNGPNISELKKKAREANDLRLLRLVGEDAQLEARANSGFLEADEPTWEKWAEADKAAKMIDK